MRHAVALGLLLLTAPAGAATIVLDFEEEAPAIYQGGSFTSAECGCVEFSAAGDRWLFVRDYAGSRTLTIGEEGGTLVLTFLVPVVGVSIDFGGDFAASEVRSSAATLTGFAGGGSVAFDYEEPNRDELVNQTLSITFGSPLSHAIFDFAQIGEFEPVSATVDRIVLTTVPEPGTLGLVALVLAALASSRSRPDAS